MFGRQVTMKLKANAAAELTRITESDIAPERAEAIANSFWDTQEDAEAYSRTAYPEVLTVLANAIEGIPTVRTFNFVSSTCNRTFAGKLS